MKRPRPIFNELSLLGRRAVLDKLLRLNSTQKESTRKAWKIFKQDPFDPRLRTHKIHRLSAHYGRPVYAVEIEGDLRSTFYIEQQTVISLTLGTHEIYRQNE